MNKAQVTQPESKLTPEQKFLAMERLSWEARALKEAGVRMIHPSWDDERVKKKSAIFFSMQVVSQVLDFTSKFEACKVPYMVTGSVAGIVYGDPRLTNDVDVVLEINPESISQLAEAFPADEYYCPPEEVMRLEAARDLRGHFNLVRNDTGFKADVYLMGSDPLHRWAMERKRRIEIDQASLWLAPPEYVILRKMEFFQEGKSSKHITDIQAILKNMADHINQTEIESMAKAKGLTRIWDKCRKLR